MTVMVKVIAEFCQNHNGDPVILQEMIHQAAENGAAYAKIQTIFAEDVTYRERFESGLMEGDKVKVIKRPYAAEVERIKKLELSFEQQERFILDCRKCGIEPLTTCFTRASVARLATMGWDTIKVASYDCASLPLLFDLAQKFKRLIVSTGASYDAEIESAAAVLKKHGAEFAFLHCVTLYPTPLSELHLNRMNYLRSLTPHVGLSSHPLTVRDGVKPDLAAIYLGAAYVERHFTVLDPDKSRDGPVSIRPEHLREIVQFSKLTKEDQKQYIAEHVPEFGSMLGLERRPLSDAELLNRDYYRGRFATHVNGKPLYNWEEST